MSSGRVIIKIPKLDIPYKYVEPVLIPVDKLVPHEEIVEGRLKDLIEKIKSENAVDMPIVVARIPGSDKYLIVDGHHRWAALKEMGYKLVPCVVIDYFSDDVRLMTWYPAVIGDISPILEELEREGVEYNEIKCPDRKIDDNLLEGNAFIIVGQDKCFEIRGGIEEQKIVSRVLSKLNIENKFILAYYGDLEEALTDLKKGEITYLFIRKNVTKEEVIEMARQNRVYAPKTTRHILPYYPAKTYTPLEKLKITKQKREK